VQSIDREETEMLPIAKKQKVIINENKHIASCWYGKIGILDRWIFDGFYIVLIHDQELVFNYYSNEFTVLEEGE